ncbi:hypothetical protein [Clostridium grantii]|uniref:DUF4064 domain-containing protein n=1 Tax=Clostridium grantii DSM 8605 TaxID=1121316 RepID=A0A1M5V826_9CLOT|nr:hypothetical protein [Clostridium grantii]SHH71375.1 hypothetical protein SAMN02745207_02160 [Clostridium grantii DSM 8605]
MKKKWFINLYGIFELLIAVAAIIVGISMVSSPNGLVGSFPPEFPEEWLDKVLFTNWFIPGIIAILIFGLGNFIAGISTFIKNTSTSCILGITMGGVLLISIILQMMILDVYLVSVEFLVISIIQLVYGIVVIRN